MTVKTIISLVFAYSLFLVCCTTVQTRYNIKAKAIADDTTSQHNTKPIQAPTQIVVEQREPEKLIEPPDKDTLVIILNSEENNTNDTATLNFSRANELFELKDYKNALELYRFIIPKIEKTNPNYWNARFRYEECKIQLGKVDEGIEGIEFLISLIEQTHFAKETLLARFVRILCENNKKQKAKHYFEILKKDFPSSQYKKEIEALRCF